jgi:hypothetical protein
MIVLVTLVPLPFLQINAVSRETNIIGLAPLLKHLLALKNERWVSVHEVVVLTSLAKRLPLGRLPKILQRRCTVHLVQ